ncbi:hypothetical protein RQP46_000510 [Phenoliferia psychrophenolica]
MGELAALTFNDHDFVEIIETLEKRLDDKGKRWRHVFKSLLLLDYMVKNGGPNVVKYLTKNLFVVKTLHEFVYVDEHGTDRGANVRQKAKEITNLVLDPRRLRDARKHASLGVSGGLGAAAQGLLQKRASSASPIAPEAGGAWGDDSVGVPRDENWARRQIGTSRNSVLLTAMRADRDGVPQFSNGFAAPRKEVGDEP